MIAIDTSSFIAFLQGNQDENASAVERAIQIKAAVLPPVVVSELLSDPSLDSNTEDLIKTIRQIKLTEGYWERVGALKRKVHLAKRKVRLADAMVAQACLDQSIPLLTRDKDFHAFALAADLNLTP